MVEIIRRKAKDPTGFFTVYKKGEQQTLEVGSFVPEVAPKCQLATNLTLVDIMLLLC